MTSEIVYYDRSGNRRTTPDAGFASAEGWRTAYLRVEQELFDVRGTLVEAIALLEGGEEVRWSPHLRDWLAKHKATP